MTAPNTPETIAKRAEEFAHSLEELSGLQLDFSASSLSTLDDWLAEWIDMVAIYDAPTTLPDAALVESIAAYVGESLIRFAGAAWDFTNHLDDAVPPLHFASGQHIDLHAAVVAVLQRQASPAFHELARLQ